MKIIFGEKEIKYNEQALNYEDLKTDNVNSFLYRLLVFCISNEENLEFEMTDNCTPFGKKFKEILEEEFTTKQTI